MTTTTTATKPTNITTGKVRFSYLNCWEPKAIEAGQDPKYSVSLIIDKDSKEGKATVAKIKAAVEFLTAEAKVKYAGKLPPKFKLPLRDGDTDEGRADDEAYKNSFFINANNKNKPGIVDKNLNAIINKDELYSGCFGRAAVSFFLYDKAGNRGIGCSLNHLQKLDDGDALSSAVSAEVAFSDGYEGDDDLMS